MRLSRLPHSVLLLLVVTLLPTGAASVRADTLLVGPGRALAKPSDAAAVARDGDTVSIDPAIYYDCAVWHADRLTIQASGSGAVLTDSACQGKAAFVIDGDDVVVRNLTFTRIRVADANGAGIRAEGGRLTVVASRFVDNQVGILAASGELRVTDCEFDGNGVPRAADVTPGTGRPRGHDIQAGRLGLLLVSGSHMQNGRGLSAIDSRATRTELRHNRLSGPAPLISLDDGGSVLIEANSLELTGADAGRAAVLIAEDGDQPAGARMLRANTLVDRNPGGAVLLRNWSAQPPGLEANVVAPGDLEMARDGAWMNYAKTAAHHLIDRLRSLAGAVRHSAAVLIGWSPA